MNQLLTALLLVVSPSLYADTALVKWVPPIERADGTALTAAEIAGYNVRYTDGEPGVYPHKIETKAESIVVPLLNVPRQLVVTTVDTDGQESAYSELVTLPADKPSPGAPTSITITITYD